MPDQTWTFKLDDKHHVVTVKINAAMRRKTTVYLENQVIAEGRISVHDLSNAHKNGFVFKLDVPFIVDGVPCDPLSSRHICSLKFYKRS